MTSNYTRTGTDLDKILITQADKANVPTAYRKAGANSIWGVFGVGYGWGDDYYGELGNGASGDSGYPDYIHLSYAYPTQILNVTQWKLVSAGRYGHSAGIKNDGTLWTWGNNSYGELGGGSSRITPVQVGALTNWSSVSAGRSFNLAVKTDGTLWSWGVNVYGQLGDGTVTSKSSPVQVGLLTTWSSVAVGGYALYTTYGGFSHAIKTDGTLWSWGNNTYGQLGQNDTTNRSSPVQVGALTNWSKVSGGQSYTLAIKTNGTLWAWGRNNFGQLGDGTVTSKSSPVQVGALTTWSLVSAGAYTALAVKTDGTLWSWGYNNQGQLGDGTVTSKSSPVQVGALTTWSSVSTGDYHCFAIKTDGTLWAWGYNQVGQLGDGSTANKSSPVQVGTSNNWSVISGGAAVYVGFSLGIIKQDLTG
jgi:alpha-tubulin suppressor-like RCC1 family protein